MGRRPREPEDDDGDMTPAAPLPPRKIGGKPNIEYHRERQRRFDVLMDNCLNAETAIPFNADTMQKSITASAILDGFTEKSMKDMRSEAEKMSDAIERLLAENGSHFEQDDADLELIEKGVKEAEEHAEKIINDRRGVGDMLPHEIHELQGSIDRGKTIRSRIKRILRLRATIRTAHKPVKNENPDPWNDKTSKLAAREAIAPLVFMLYTLRADTASMVQHSSKGVESRVLRIGRHHARFACTLWQGLNGVVYDKAKGLILRNERDYKGVVLIAPPGHGKSVFLMAVVMYDIGLRNMAQWTYIHAIADQAEAALGFIRQGFDKNTAIGRRLAAIFPGMDLDAKDNNQTKMRLKLPVWTKSPTVTAAGVTAKALGSNTDRQARDDVVPQSDRDQPTERERRKSIIGGTWGSRQRGTKYFSIDIGTMWHPDDYLCDVVQQARRGKIPILVDIQRCGGPVPTEHGPAFYPLWPDVYPASELKRRFEQMRDRSVWSAAYEANPLAEDLQVIRSLAYYDPTDKEHTDFMDSAQFHVSVDPTATNRESSDMAGMIYAGLGEISHEKDGQRFWENRLRILDAQQQHVNQVELADFVARYALSRPVYQVHVETRSGFHATADIISNKFGLEVQRHDPTNQKKLVRLKACAGLIDSSLQGLHALVEFPGKRDKDGKIVPDNDRWGWLYNQFLKFGFAEDHVVDATTQLCNHFIRTGDLRGGEGEASETIRKAVSTTGDPRIIAMLAEADRRTKTGGPSAAAEEVEWEQTRWGQ